MRFRVFWVLNKKKEEGVIKQTSSFTLKNILWKTSGPGRA